MNSVLIHTCNQEYLEQKYGKGAGSRMAASLEKVGQASGIRFDNERRVHNTIKSHRLVRFADAQNKGNEMIEQLFHGYFEEGKNIADIDVLLELAQKVLLEQYSGSTILLCGACTFLFMYDMMFIVKLSTAA